MNARDVGAGDPRFARFRFWVLATFLILFVPVGVLAKQSMASFFIAVCVLTLGAVLAEHRRVPAPERSVLAGFALIVLLAGLGALLGTGGYAPDRAAEKLAMLGLLLVTVSAAPAIRAGLPAKRLVLCFTAGIWLGALIYLVEVSFDAPLYRFFSGKGELVDVAISRFNRGSTALVLLSWPAAAGLWLTGFRRAALLTLLAGLGVAFLGESAAAALAAVIGVLALPLALLNGKIASRLVLVLAALLMLAAPWLFLHMMSWFPSYLDVLPPSFAERLEIWNAASLQATANPLLGDGIGAMRVLRIPPEVLHSYALFKGATTHPHNAAIQIWLELGLVGIFAVLLLLWRLIRATDRAVQPLRGAMISCLAAGLVIASVSYGLWQETWLGIIGFTILAFGILPRDDSASD